MGCNTTVVIHNDDLHTIAHDPDFGKNLAMAIQSANSTGNNLVPVSARSNNKIVCNAAEVVESHHADQIVVVAVGANAGKVLGYGGHWSIMDDKVSILKILADQEGYTLRKKPRRD